MLLVIARLTHPVTPEYRWVLIHLFTLGAVTNSILIWSQYFTEKLPHRTFAPATRPGQLLRLANWVRSGRLVPGQELRINAGIITAEVNGWRTIAGHHTQGMAFDVLVTAD